MRRLSTSDMLKLLTLGTSLAGMLCMSLADLLPWGAFLLFAAVHAVIGKWFYDSELISQKTAIVIFLFVMFFEVLGVSYRGSAAVVILVRDMILTLAFIRLVMKKTPREIYQIVGISFAQCLLATIFTISPLFLVGLLFMVILVPMTLNALDANGYSSSEISHNQGLFHWIRITVGIILTSCLLFYVLPRPTSSIIQHSFIHRNTVNYTEDVDLKKIASDKTDNDIMMRIIWTSGKPPSHFYLSGSRLEGISPDGFYKDEFQGSAPITSDGFTDSLKIYPDSLYSKYILFPYWFKDVFPNNRDVRGSNIYWTDEVPYVYDVRVNRRADPGIPCKTDLPKELLMVGDLGKQVAKQGDIGTKTKRIARYLQSAYSYTLERQNIPPGRSAISWFVFSGRKGSCEYFASALAAMIRGCGIPARVVTGFLVTEYNESGNYFIVRASDAHAWVEYWDGIWYSIDATPYGRQISGLRLHILDELRFRWLRWVIQYSLNDQIRFALKIFVAAPRINKQIENISSYALYLFISGLLLWLFYLLYKDRSLPPYDKIRKAMSRKRLWLPENSSHECHITFVKEKWPSLEEEFRDYLEHYLAWRFREDRIDIQTHTKKIIERIKSLPRG